MLDKCSTADLRPLTYFHGFYGIYLLQAGGKVKAIITNLNLRPYVMI